MIACIFCKNFQDNVIKFIIHGCHNIINGDLSTYTPDFIIRTTDGTVWIAETKGREELDLPQKMTRLRQWSEDATSASKAESGPDYRFVYVDEEGYDRNPPSDFAGLVSSFREYQSTS